MSFRLIALVCVFVCQVLPLLADDIARASAKLATQEILLEDLERSEWQPDARRVYKTVDGLELPMMIFLPQDRHDLSDKRPAVIGLHGGSWSGWKGGEWRTWDGSVFLPHARYFAARGAVGVLIDYRHVPRPNEDQEGFEKGVSVFDLLADCRAAIRFLRKHAAEYGIDPNRIAVIGDSAGGHLAACLGTIDRYDDPDEDTSISGMANATIPSSPITDMTDPRWMEYVPKTPRAGEKDKPLSPEERAKLISPLWNISTSSAPSLVLHGLKDITVDPRHSIEFKAKMDEAGVRCDLLTLPDATHAFILLGYTANYFEVVSAIRRADIFLASLGYLQGEPTLELSPPDALPRRCVARFQFNKINADRRLASDDNKNTFATPMIAADIPRSNAMAVLIDDQERGQVLKVASDREGLKAADLQGMGPSTTISLWIKPDRLGGTLARRTCGFGTDVLGYNLALNQAGGLTLKVGGVVIEAAEDAPKVQAQAWNHVVATIGRDRAMVYLNGKKILEKNYPSTTLSGLRLNVAASFEGAVSDLRIFNYALGEDELKLLD